MKRLAILALLSLAACKIPIGTVPCNADTQCGNGQICGGDGTCTTAPVCATGERLCGHVCTDITSTTNCGACGNVCASGETCSGGTCTIPLDAAVITAPQYADQGATGLVATVTSHDPDATYAWTISGGTYADGTGTATGGQVHFNAGTGSVLTLEVVGTNTAGDHVTGKATVTLIPPMPASLTITTASVVSSNAINIPASATSIANATYAWTISNGVLQQTTGTNIEYASGNSGQVTLSATATSLSGSTASGQAVVQIVPTPGSLVITADPTAALVGQSGLKASVVAQAGVSFAWRIIGGTFADLTATATGTDVTYTAGLGPAVVLTCIGTNAAGATENGSVAVPVSIGTTTSLTAVGGANQVQLRWDGVPGATKYHVLRAGSASATPVQLTDVNTTNTIDGSLPNGKRYYYQVVAATNFIDGLPSATATALTNLPAPTNLSAKNGATIPLTWTGVPNATQYTVLRKTGSAAYAAIGAATTTSFTDSAGLIEGLTYSYVVHALTADAESVDSNTATAITTLDPPTGLTASVNNYDVTLTWTPNPAATGYDILRSTSPTGGFTVIDTVGSTSTYCNCSESPAPPEPATTYYYEVVATTASTESVPSDVASATTFFPPPSAPSVEIQNRNTVVLNWDAVSGATNYSVQRSSSPNGPFTEIGETGNTTYTDPNLDYATTYYYQIVVIAPGPSLPSQVSSATTDVSPFRKATGVFGGEIQVVAFDPNVSSKAWAGVHGGAGVYSSTDSGATWTANGAGLGAPSVHALAFSAGAVLAGTRGAGVYLLASGATRWTAANSGLVATDTYNALAADPANGGTVYAASYTAVYLSANSGGSWKATAFAPTAPVTSLAIHPTDPKTVYAATDGAGVFVTHDSGAHWSALGPSAASCQGGLLVDSANPTHLWVGTGNGVFASTDGGQSWSAVGSLTQVRSLARSGGTLFASTNGGGVWVNSGEGFQRAPGSAAVGGATTIAVSGSTLLAGSVAGAGLFRSSDTGSSWGITNTGVAAASAPALAVSAIAPSTLFGIAGYTVVKSSDGGGSWTQAMGSGVSYPVISSAIALDPSSSSTVLVGAQGVLRSTDSGNTWQSTNANFSPLALALASSSTGFAAVYDVGVYVSTNLNSESPTWTPASTGLTGQGIRTVAVAGGGGTRGRAPDRVATAVYAAGDHGFWTSTNFGANWTAASPQLQLVRAIAVDARVAGTVYALVAGGVGGSQLRRSTDSGATWTDLGFGSTASENLVSISVDPTNSRILFALGTNSNGSVGGLYKSTDAGATWSDVSAGLGTRQLRAVALHPSTSGTLFVASDDNGFFVSTSGGL